MVRIMSKTDWSPAEEPPEHFKGMLGRLLGIGSEKRCYLHPTDARRCIKICSKRKSTQTRREIAYFKYLKANHRFSNCIPELYSVSEDEDCLWFEQECFLSVEEGGTFDVAETLTHYIESSGKTEAKIFGELEELRRELLRNNIICCDMAGCNILRVTKEGQSRFVVIDGFGSPELIPLAQYWPPLGRIKIERQWNKLKRRLKSAFSK